MDLDFFFDSIAWNYMELKIEKDSMIVLLIPSLLGILSEILQKTKLINGTFDPIDLSFYIIGGFFGFLLIISLNINHKFKTL